MSAKNSAASDPRLGELLSASLLSSPNRSDIIHLKFASIDRVDGQVNAYFYPEAGRKPLLDWESFTGSGGQDWESFIRERNTDTVLLRCYLSMDYRLSPEFVDDPRSIFFVLKSPDGKNLLRACCEMDTPVHKALQSAFISKDEFSGRSARSVGSRVEDFLVTVRVAFPADSQSGQSVRLVSLVAPRWLLVNGEE